MLFLIYVLKLVIFENKCLNVFVIFLLKYSVNYNRNGMMKNVNNVNF